MRIKEIHLFEKEFAVLGEPYTMAGTTLSTLNSIIAKVVTSSGLIGWGEACPLGATYQEEHAKGILATLELVSPQLLGMELSDPSSMIEELDRLVCGHNSAKSVLDCASLDLLGQHHKVPSAALIGEIKAKTVPAYCALGLLAPEELTRHALDKVAMGYRRIQLKLGRAEIAEDIEAVTSVVRALESNIEIIADANRGLSKEQTLFFSNGCADLPIKIEQPCATTGELASINPRIHHPLIIDENADSVAKVAELIGQKACTSFGLKVSRLGGLNHFSKVRDLTQRALLPVTCDDTFGGDIVAAACVHGAVTVEPGLFSGSWIAQEYIAEHYDDESPIKVHRGQLSLPQGNGLGIRPDETKIGSLAASFG
ncbi:MAG: mandelate racemase/muconate lactonizing enzyme family protein [Pseudomonadota bacterium]